MTHTARKMAMVLAAAACLAGAQDARASDERTKGTIIGGTVGLIVGGGKGAVAGAVVGNIGGAVVKDARRDENRRKNK